MVWQTKQTIETAYGLHLALHDSRDRRKRAELSRIKICPQFFTSNQKLIIQDLPPIPFMSLQASDICNRRLGNSPWRRNLNRKTQDAPNDFKNMV